MRFMIDLGLIKLQESPGKNVESAITPTSESTSIPPTPPTSPTTLPVLSISFGSGSSSTSPSVKILSDFAGTPTEVTIVSFSSTTPSLESPGHPLEVDTVISSTSSIASSTSSFYPLTTVFVPPAECTSFYLNTCYGTTECIIDIWPEYLCTKSGDHYFSCYPSYESGHARTMYSPGLPCPQGMTTAASAISPAGVWCCPMGLTWASSPPWCWNKVDTGTFHSGDPCYGTHSIITFGSSGLFVSSSAYMVADEETSASGGANWMQTSLTIQLNAAVFTAQAKGIFLEGQSITPTATTLSTKIGAGTIPSSVDDAPTNSPSRSILIAAVVGGVLGACILVGLGYALWRRKRSRGAVQDNNLIDTGANVNGTDPGGMPHDDYRKAELDTPAQATRSELEGSTELNYGAGIYVRKPELEGTQGESHTEGSVYVKNKAELEAHMRAAELEAIPWSVRKEEKTLPPSPTIPGPSRFST
ncbi:hypothetical protein K445DRAFT_21933 [Daldinia sp. EC12]|nr:hypothetical protein K445DRAFT_21933 [Daldinia sp. EC12]